MRRHARWLWGPLMLVALACEQPASPDPQPAGDSGGPRIKPAPPAEPKEGAPAPPGADDLPTEPVVRMLEPGKRRPEALEPRAPGTSRRIVVEVRITEGKNKTLHVPVTRVAGDVVLDSIGDDGSRYRWTPRQTTVLADEGVEAEFLTAFEAALAPGEAPAAVPLVTDRWDVVTELDWPTDSNPHAAEIGVAQRLSLSHLALPVPELELAEGATWQINRRVDLLGLPAWQTLDCKAKKITGKQIEIDADVTYRLIEGEPITRPPLGLPSVAALTGQGKLHGRFDLPSATPVDMQLQGVLLVTPAPGQEPRRFGFELRADEDYMAQPDPRVKLEGQLTQGGLVIGVVPPGTKVWFNKRAVKVSDAGDFLIGFGRDAGPRALLAFAFDGGPDERHILHVEDREFEPEVIDGLPAEMVDLDKKTRKALTKSRARVKKLRNESSDVPYFRDGFRWPAKGVITSSYGRRRTLNGEDHGYHWGVDLGARVGGKVKAPAAGVVVLAESDVPLSGNLLILDHGHGLTSSFLHLQKFKVKVGDVVEQGQVIATIGNTGRSTGPHLDWRMNLFDTRIDPQTLVPPKP
ncbi:MAG: peptidoglycan DD-metalloendopeptidase family protein [Myxococcales bacterium]|nr:peptidoglycan DD-metalloendopeptidase family protein [Myxococcales bacterium]